MLRRHIQEQFTWVDDPEHTFQDTMLIYLLMHLGGIEQVLTGILDRLGGDVKSAYPYKRNGDEDL